MDNCLKVGDWVIIDGAIVGEVWSMHTPIDIIDVWIQVSTPHPHIETIRAKHHQLTKITREVADIMRGV